MGLGVRRSPLPRLARAPDLGRARQISIVEIVLGHRLQRRAEVPAVAAGEYVWAAVAVGEYLRPVIPDVAWHDGRGRLARAPHLRRARQDVAVRGRGRVRQDVAGEPLGEAFWCLVRVRVRVRVMVRVELGG